MANYGYILEAKASDQMHQMVYTDPDEAREASIYYYNNGSESYIVETSVVEHVAATPMAEYGFQHAQSYGSPVKSHWRARPPEVSNNRGFGSYPTKARVKDFDGGNDVYYDNEVRRAQSPEVNTGRRFGGYPTKNTFKDVDGVNDAYEYPFSVYDTEYNQPDDPDSPPGSAYYPLKKPSVHKHAEKAEQFVPGFQSRASQPTWTDPSNSYSYARPNYAFGDNKMPSYDVYDKDKSGENPVFSSLRDLYLEYRKEKNPNSNNKADSRRPDHPSKPTGRAGTAAMNFPIEVNKLPSVNPAASKHPQLNRPVYSPERNMIHPEMTGSFGAAKEHGRYSPPPNPRDRVSSPNGAMANIKSKDNYGKSNHLLGKLPNVNTAAGTQPRLNWPASTPDRNIIRPEMTGSFEAAKEHGRYSPSPNPREIVSSPDGAMANTKSKDDYGKSNYLHGKLPNVNPAAAKQLTRPAFSQQENNIRPEMTGSFGAAEQYGTYSPPRNPGQKLSGTPDGAMKDFKIEDDYRKSNNPLSKPTGYAASAKNFATEAVNKLPNVNPAAAKQPQLNGPVSSSWENNIRPETTDSLEPAKQQGKYSPLPNSREDKLSNVPAATKPARSWGSVLSPEKTANLEGANQHAQYSTSPPNYGDKKSRFIGSKEAVEKYDGAFVPYVHN